MNTSSDIRTRLERFVQRLDGRKAVLERISTRYSRVRLVIVLSGIVVAYFIRAPLGPAGFWSAVAVFFLAFAVTARLHDRVVRSIRKHRIYARIKTAHVARIERNWSDLRPSACPLSTSEHPFARDLDLTGPKSIHHLLDTSFTKEGSERLRAWLLEPVLEPKVALERQRLVRELVPLTRFRDRLSLLSELVSSDPNERWKGDVLIRWLDRHIEQTRIRLVLAVLSALATLTFVLIGLNLAGLVGSLFLLSFAVYAAVYLFNFRLYSHLFDEAEHLYYQLNRFRPVLRFIESNSMKEGSCLARICEPFHENDKPPSRYLKNIMWLSVAASAQKNDVIRLVLNAVLPWDLLFTFLLHNYKDRLRDRLPAWLDAVRTLEAAGALATFATLNPEMHFPSIAKAAALDRPFDARALGHPLIPSATNVRNDFRIDDLGDLALVTGSNMSGKSTFLRTIGVNLALAGAGSAVDAESLTTSGFRLFTSMNVADSVTDGVSYFYAEVRRLKRLLDTVRGASDHPVLFLIDEIFRGTNNRERFVGGRSLLLSLIGGFGAGVVSTHDLDLVRLEEEEPKVRNYHFREAVEAGRMVFDYRLRPGPCPTTNALKIMQMEGLPVERPGPPPSE